MLQDMLNELRERELDKLEAKRLDLTQKVYASLPEIIERTSELTGVPEEDLVRVCVQTAWQYQDLEWHDVLDIVRSFYLARKRIEESKKQEE